MRHSQEEQPSCVCVFPLLDRYEHDARSDLALYQQVLERIVLAAEPGFNFSWIGEHHGQISLEQPLCCHTRGIMLYWQNCTEILLTGQQWSVFL